MSGFCITPSPSQGGVGGSQQSKALLRRSGSALQGRAFGWDGGQSVEHKPQVFEVLTPTPTLPQKSRRDFFKVLGGGSKS